MITDALAMARAMKRIVGSFRNIVEKQHYG